MNTTTTAAIILCVLTALTGIALTGVDKPHEVAPAHSCGFENPIQLKGWRGKRSQRSYYWLDLETGKTLTLKGEANEACREAAAEK